MNAVVWFWALAVNFIAYKNHYYHLPKSSQKRGPFVTHLQLIVSFGIYLGVALVLAPVFAKVVLRYLHNLNPEIVSLSLLFLTSLQFCSMLAIFLLLLTYFFNQDPTLLKQIWKDREFASAKPVELDFGLGALTWILSFPIVSILGDFLDKLLKFFFNYSPGDQTAVQFVKLASSSPMALILALLSVLILAPLIEEFLFRGILQNHLKKRLGAKSAILLSAFFFALFHFSLSQNLSNITLILSLFVLGGYLGFLYERQKSLWAPIGLHMTFNAISALRILLSPETLS